MKRSPWTCRACSKPAPYREATSRRSTCARCGCLPPCQERQALAFEELVDFFTSRPRLDAPALDYEAAASELGCGPAKVRKLVQQGKLESAPRHGRSPRVTRASVERLLAPAEPPKKKAPKAPAPTASPAAANEDAPGPSAAALIRGLPL